MQQRLPRTPHSLTLTLNTTSLASKARRAFGRLCVAKLASSSKFEEGLNPRVFLRGKLVPNCPPNLSPKLIPKLVSSRLTESFYLPSNVPLCAAHCVFSAQFIQLTRSTTWAFPHLHRLTMSHGYVLSDQPHSASCRGALILGTLPM